MSEKSKKFKSPGFDKRSSRTKNEMEMTEVDDNILDEHIDGQLPNSQMMTSLDSQRHGNYFSTETSNTSRSGNGNH